MLTRLCPSTTTRSRCIAQGVARSTPSKTAPVGEVRRSIRWKVTLISRRETSSTQWRFRPLTFWGAGRSGPSSSYRPRSLSESARREMVATLRATRIRSSRQVGNLPKGSERSKRKRRKMTSTRISSPSLARVCSATNHRLVSPLRVLRRIPSSARQHQLAIRLRGQPLARSKTVIVLTTTILITATICGQPKSQRSIMISNSEWSTTFGSDRRHEPR